jgi:hypothetical protein
MMVLLYVAAGFFAFVVIAERVAKKGKAEHELRARREKRRLYDHEIQMAVIQDADGYTNASAREPRRRGTHTAKPWRGSAGGNLDAGGGSVQ